MGLPASHRPDLPLLEHTQELALQSEAHLPNLVQKECPAVGQFEESRLVLICPGESPPDVTEQLALQETLR